MNCNEMKNGGAHLLCISKTFLFRIFTRGSIHIFANNVHYCLKTALNLVGSAIYLDILRGVSGSVEAGLFRTAVL